VWRPEKRSHEDRDGKIKRLKKTQIDHVWLPEGKTRCLDYDGALQFAHL